MKRLALLGFLLVISSGCGRCWNSIFRGAPCATGQCVAPAPAPTTTVDNGCVGCGDTVMGYGTYDGVVTDGIVTDGYTLGSTYLGEVPSSVPSAAPLAPVNSGT